MEKKKVEKSVLRPAALSRPKHLYYINSDGETLSKNMLL